MVNTILLILSTSALISSISLFIHIYCKLTAKQQDKVEKLAAQAIAFVESRRSDATGQQKMSLAVELLRSWVSKKYSVEKIEALIQHVFNGSALKH